MQRSRPAVNCLERKKLEIFHFSVSLFVKALFFSAYVETECITSQCKLTARTNVSQQLGASGRDYLPLLSDIYIHAYAQTYICT